MSQHTIIMQLPVADRMAAVLALYLEEREKLTPEERAGFAAMFQWFPQMIQKIEPFREEEPGAPPEELISH